MNKPVLQILGGMLVNDNFRADMTAPGANLAAVIQSYQFDELTGAEMDVAANIVASFQQGKMDGPIQSVRSECPNWPCN